MTSGFVKTKHDIGLTVGATTTGFMLRKSTNVLPQYQVFDDEYLAQQFFTGEPGYANLPPEKELAIRQDDWRSGLGLEVYDGNDPRRYHKSTMDMRRRGLGLAGVASTAIAMPASSTTAALANTDMELAASWTGGARSSTQAHGGTYSWKLGAETAYQNATTWTTDWRGRAFTVV